MFLIDGLVSGQKPRRKETGRVWNLHDVPINFRFRDRYRRTHIVTDTKFLYTVWTPHSTNKIMCFQNVAIFHLRVTICNKCLKNQMRQVQVTWWFVSVEIHPQNGHPIITIKISQKPLFRYHRYTRWRICHVIHSYLDYCKTLRPLEIDKMPIVHNINRKIVIMWHLILIVDQSDSHRVPTEPSSGWKPHRQHHLDGYESQ